MNNLREHLEDKYITNRSEEYSVKAIAEEVMDLLNADKENYIDVTGFAKDFYLDYSLPKEEKELYYQTLKARGFFQQLNSNLDSKDFPVCSWSIYTIGKFSNIENAGYLETAYETCFQKNPILSYRCLSELKWLGSEKVNRYLEDLKAGGSFVSKLILLYYWDIRSASQEFKDLLADKELMDLVVPGMSIDDYEEEVTSRLFAFENHISGLYVSMGNDSIDRDKFEIFARSYFEKYFKVIDENTEKDHQDFLRKFGGI